MSDKSESISLGIWIVIGTTVIFIVGAFVYQNFQQQINDLRNRPPEIKTETIIKETPQEVSQTKEVDYSSIIAEWQDRVAKVECNTNSGLTFQGSGVLVNIAGIGTSVITNKHVILDETGKQLVRNCVIGVYKKGARIVGTDIEKNPFILGETDDWAYIKLTVGWDSFSGEFEPNQPQDTSGARFDTIVKNRLKVCSGTVNLGDKLVVLGYPAIGTTGGITATEGIVSGIENNYYVTSAKIEHGNSGGAAILVKDDCYLGIPTWANSGSVESLARILKSNIVLGD